MVSLVLASASPQRRTLLSGLGVPFKVEPSTIDESAFLQEIPTERAVHLARMKAQDVARTWPDAVVIGCDTLVEAADGTLLEKPRDAADAERMLRAQSGRVSRVHSGLCIVHPDGRLAEGLSTSSVHFAHLDDRRIAWWVASGAWRDRSGSFQIDGPGQVLIEHLEGDWTGVVGLPVFLLGSLLQSLDIDICSLGG